MTAAKPPLSVRPLAREDLAELARIRLDSFGTTHHRDPEALAAYLGNVFLEHPWRDERLHSFVAERGGRIAGFLGVLPRPFMVDGERVTASMLSHFMVRASERGSGVGSTLMTEWLSGPQSFSWSDVANLATRAIMTRHGAQPLRLHGMAWTTGVRPLSSSAALLELPALGRVVRRALRGPLRAADRVVRTPPTTTLRIDVASPAELAEAASQLPTARVRPVYDERSLAWLLDRLKEHVTAGPLRAAVARDSDGTPAGWFVYFVRAIGIAQVAAVAARPTMEHAVVDALREDAWQQGVVTLEGRLEPHLLAAMSDRGFAFQRRDPHVLVHTCDVGLLTAIVAGECFLSRLDGEWWMYA